MEASFHLQNIYCSSNVLRALGGLPVHPLHSEKPKWNQFNVTTIALMRNAEGPILQQYANALTHTLHAQPMWLKTAFVSRNLLRKKEKKREEEKKCQKWANKQTIFPVRCLFVYVFECANVMHSLTASDRTDKRNCPNKQTSELNVTASASSSIVSFVKWIFVNKIQGQKIVKRHAQQPALYVYTVAHTCGRYISYYINSLERASISIFFWYENDGRFEIVFRFVGHFDGMKSSFCLPYYANRKTIRVLCE